MSKRSLLFWTISVVIIFCLPLTGIGQGKGCSNPEIINILPFNSPDLTSPNVLNTCGENEFNSTLPCGNIFLNGDEYTFRYKATYYGCLKAKLNMVYTGPITNDNAALFIYEGCPSDPNTICIDQTVIPKNGTLRDETFSIKKNKEYYFVVSSRNACFNFQMTLEGANQNCNLGQGKNPNAATLIPSSPYSKYIDFASTTDISNFLNAGNLGPHVNFPDYFFKYTADGDQCINAGISESSFYNFLIYDGDPCDPNSNLLTTQPRSSVIRFPFLGGITYYFAVQQTKSQYSVGENQYPAPNTKFTFSRVSDIGDTCAIAIPLTPGKILLGQSTDCLNHDYNSEDLGNTATPLAQDKVFRFSLTDSACVTINLEDITGLISYYLLDGCPNPSANVIVSDSNTLASGPLHTQQYMGPGTYYIVVSNVVENLDNSFDIVVSTSQIHDLPGRNCSNPIPLIPGTLLTNQTTQCMYKDFQAPDYPGLSGPFGDDAVYTFTLTEPSCVTLNTENISAQDFLYATLMDDCPNAGANVIKHGAANGYTVRSIEFDLNLPAGTYYYVLSSKLEFSANSFDIILSVSPTYTDKTNCTNPYEATQFPELGYHVDTRCHFATIPSNKLCGGSNFEEYYIRIPSQGNECIEVIGRNIINRADLFLMRGCPTSNSTSCQALVVCPDSRCDSIRLEARLDQPGDYYIVVSSKTRGKSVQLDLDINKQSELDCESCGNDLCDNCLDVDFDNMKTGDWKGFYGGYTNPRFKSGIQSMGVNSIDFSKHTLINKGRQDPYIPELECTAPNGSDFSMRLGNKNAGAKGDVIELEFTPTLENNGLIYWYAVVFQDPQHTSEDQPYFKISLFDPDGKEIECAHYEVRPGAGIPGFNFEPSSNIRWKDWSPVYIPLNNYIGKKMRLQFLNLDCKLGDHFGYSYFDVECSSLNLLQSDTLKCAAEDDDYVVLTAPIGFENYLWSTGATSRSINVNEEGNYSVHLTTISGCETDLTTTVYREGYLDFKNDLIRSCFDTLITVINQSSVLGGSIDDQHTWTLPDGSQIINQDTITYPITDNTALTFNYHIETVDGCTSDTSLTIIPKYEEYKVNLPDSLFACEKDSIGIYIPHTDYDIYWTGVKQATNTHAIWFNPAAPNNTGYAYLRVAKDTCLAHLDSVYFHIEALPTPQIIAKDSICIRDNDYMVGIPNCTVPYYSGWNIASNNDTLYPISTGVYTFSVRTDLCYTSVDKHIEVSKLPQFSTLYKPEFCEGDSARIQLHLLAGDSITWWDGYPNYHRSWGSPQAIGFTAFNGVCSTDSIIQFEIIKAPTLTLGGDTSMCPGEEQTMYILDSSNVAEFAWHDGETQVPRVVNASGSYIGIAKNDFCYIKDTVHIIVFPDQSSTPTFFTCPDTTIHFDPLDYLYDYYWLPNGNQGPVLMERGKLVRYVGISPDGCEQEFETLAVMDKNCEQTVYVPNSFSPDGDLVNDAFFPKHFKGEIILFQIFNRWGELLYETPSATPWDGNYRNGLPCKPDSYVWRVIYRNRYSANVEFTGICNLIR